MGGAESKPRSRHGRHTSHLVDRPTPPGKPQLVPSDQHSAEPDVVTIRWETPLSDGGSRITGFLVEHRRTGSPHWVRSSPSLVRVPELTLSGLEPGWRYQFRVSAQNAVGLSDPGELSDLLTVTLQRTAASAPYFVKELMDTAAIENEKAELTVQVRGTPTPTISWFKDGVEIFSSRSYRVIMDNETSTLIIHQASLSDEGEIKCSATNRVGYTVTRAKLVIEAPPSIRLPRQYEEGLLFEKDEVIRLKVSVAGRPVPEVSWSLNGEPVPGGGRYEASHSERYATLRVGEARRTDRGEYQVRAVNRLGEDVASFLVTVADRPMPPGKAKVVMTLGRSVTLSWSTPEDDGGCKIGNYIVEYYRLGWNMWLKAATCRQLTTTLGELIEGSEYKFRVKAENPYGVSEPSPESDVVFIPDPKRGLLEAPEHGKADLEEMDIWQEEKKRPVSPSVNVDDQYGERKTKKKRGPMLPPQTELEKQERFEKHSMMSEDSMSPPLTPENYLPIIPKRRGRLERADGKIIDDPVKEEKELTRVLEERRKVEEFKKFEELKKAEEIKRAEEQKKIEEAKPKEGKRLAELRRRRQLQMTPESSREERDSLHGSSELMLVLVPHSRATTEDRETSKRELFESSIALEGDVAPPMSLSAPELGSDGPPENPPVRAAFSSTELLHERAMARFYQEAQEEEGRNQQRRSSLQRRRSFERKSPAKIETIPEIAGSLQDIVKTIPSLKEKYEDDIKPERPASSLDSRHKVDVVTGFLTSKADGGSAALKMQVGRKTFSRDSMDSMLSTEDPHRKILVQQTSEEDMEYEDSSFDEDEFDEEEEEPITESIIDEEIDEELEEEEEEDMSGYDRKSSLYTSESEEEAQYSYSLEEDTYHPSAVNIKYNEDSMISAYEGRGPLILGTTAKSSNFKDKEEIEGLPKDVDIKPKSILKVPKVEISTEDFSDSNQTNDQPVKRLASPEKKFEPNFSPIMPKPILKVREASQERTAPPTQRRGSGAPVAEVEPELNLPSSSRTNLDELSDYESGVKKKVRIETPEELALKEKEKELLKEKADLMIEDVEATKVLISHYSDIVAEYSKNKRPRKRLYLDYEALKAAAEKEEENAPEIPEITVYEALSKPIRETEAMIKADEPKTEVKVVRTVAQEEPEEPEQLVVHFQEKVEELEKKESETMVLAREKSPPPQKKLPPSILKRRTSSPAGPRSLSKKRSPSPRVMMRSQTLEETVKEFPPQKVISIEPQEIAETPSSVYPPRPLTPTERKVHTYCDFLMDLSLFLLACWLYLFKDERLSIPVMCLMIYRQAHEAFQKKMEAVRQSYHRKMEAITNKIPFRKKV